MLMQGKESLLEVDTASVKQTVKLESIKHRLRRLPRQRAAVILTVFELRNLTAGKKMWQDPSQQDRQCTVPQKTYLGMITLYLPAYLATFRCV